MARKKKQTTRCHPPHQHNRGKRLDHRLVGEGLASDLMQAQRLIMAGQALVDDRPVSQPGTTVRPSSVLRLRDARMPWVSRGGLKLIHAVELWHPPIKGAISLDIGSSTGGFCDVLLSHGATRLYAVDVGYGQLAWKLRQDPRLINLERTNVRQLTPEQIPEPIDFLTIDVSFLSLVKALQCSVPFLKPGAMAVVLLKPQFELPKDRVPKGGVVKDPELHRMAMLMMRETLSAMGMQEHAMCPSPVLGPKGNREFLFYLEKSP